MFLGFLIHFYVDSDDYSTHYALTLCSLLMVLCALVLQSLYLSPHWMLNLLPDLILPLLVAEQSLLLMQFPCISLLMISAIELLFLPLAPLQRVNCNTLNPSTSQSSL